MNWGSLSDFIAMGGYAPFVWGSYGVTAVLIALEILLLRQRRRRAQQQARLAAEFNHETERENDDETQN
ncbi:MAG: heme exporter protein CcmD [Chromatiales bacterium]|jgi:heme exporter protein D|nr:heme exporter protein CcmD [Chromatiales bacterium]MDX9765778.1 heme exporter protein CcmD [Ectothiorhodospiraceae bacterium]